MNEKVCGKTIVRTKNCGRTFEPVGQRIIKDKAKDIFRNDASCWFLLPSITADTDSELRDYSTVQLPSDAISGSTKLVK